MEKPFLQANKIRDGLKLDKKLKSGFYQFIYDKQIDWAIILASFFVMLPYIASKIWYFLFLKAVIFILVVFTISRYLLKWRKLKEYYQVDDEWKKVLEKLIKPDHPEEVNAILKKITFEIEKLTKKLDEKEIKYASLKEYYENEKSDFESIDNLLNENKDAISKTFGITFSLITTLIKIRTLPFEEAKNYNRILIIIALTVIFFLIYTIEIFI